MSIRHLASYFIQSAGVAAFTFMGLASMAVRHAGSILGSAAWTVWVMASVSGAIGFWLWRTGKQLRAPSAIEAQADDKRPPILYLRSFNADSAANSAAQQGVFARLLPMSFPWNLSTEEEQIGLVMSQFGPFVAIGRPGEQLAQLGAARTYTTDENWQEVVLDLLGRSQLIIMRVGKTAGFWWEVANVSTLPNPNRVVFLLPASTEDYDLFRARAQEYLPKALPKSYTPKIMADRTFGGVMWFDADWTPHIALCSNAINIARYSVAADLRVKLAPIFDQLRREQLIDAPPRRRLAAAAVDILISVGIAISYFGAVQFAKDSGLIVTDLWEIFGPIIVFSIYFAVLEASPLQATLGKRFLGLRTLDRAGVPLALLPSLVRCFIKFIEAVSSVWIASLVLVFSGRPPIHDLLTRSIVVFRRPGIS